MLRVWAVALALSAAHPAAAQWVRVSAAADGTAPNGDSYSGVMSADGRFVAFVSEATNLVAGDTNQHADVFVKDLQTGAVDRVSVATDGSERAADSGVGGIDLSWDGRYVVFSSTAVLADGDWNRCVTTPPAPVPCPDIYLRDRAAATTTRLDMTTDGRSANGGSDHPRISDDGRFVVFASWASNLVAGDSNRVADVFLLDRSTGITRRASVTSDGQPADTGSADPEISGDGSTVVFLSDAGNLDAAPDPLACRETLPCTRVFVHDVARAATARVPVVAPTEPGLYRGPAIITAATVDAHGTQVAIQTREFGFEAHVREQVWIHERLTGRETAVLTTTSFSAHSAIASYSMAMSDDGRVLAAAVSRAPLHNSGILTFDRDSAAHEGVPQCADPLRPLSISRDGRSLIVATQCWVNYPMEADSWLDVYVYTRHDADGDGIDDDWERAFQLDPADPTDATLDRDGDGRTSRQEYRAGTHPNTLVTRYLAEGAANAFFSTRLAVLNTSSEPAAVVVRLLGANGFSTSRVTTIAAHRQVTLDYGRYADVPATDFAIVIEADRAIVAERTMVWDATGFGAHAETAVAAPAQRWLLAEGATHGAFSTFYLLLNPNDVESVADVTYLRPAPAPPIARSYWLAPHSRRTIAVDTEDPGLAATDVAADIVATQPIVVERAMYLDVAEPAQPFGAGHVGAGVAPAPQWFLAEGATGDFFDLFYLIANPSLEPVVVRITYLLPADLPVIRDYTVAGRSRLTIAVETEDPRLAATAVSAVVEALDGTGIAVERSMWWPGGGWQEGHLSAGAPAAGLRWAIAGGEVSDATETYVLIANPSAFPALATLTILPEQQAPDVRTVALPPASRVTVPMSQYASTHGARFGVMVESHPSEVVVERVTYTTAGGVFWAAGTAALATRLP